MNNEDVIRLFDAYSDDLYRFAVSFVGTKQEAEDIVQDVFVKLIAKRIRLDPQREKKYLMTMTANKCKDHLRSSAHKTTVDLESEEWNLQYYDGFTDRNKAVFDELMGLDGRFRIPIYLHYYEGYSYKEIAGILKLSESAVAMRISRGKEQLRIRLEEE